MGKNNDPKDLAKLINCLGFFEKSVSSLYEDIARRVWLPLIEALILEISQDSQKHYTILKALAESLPKTDTNSKDYINTIGETWCTIEKFRREITETQSLSEDEIMQLSSQLIPLENTLAGEYEVFLQPDTLQMLTTELQRIYRIDADVLRAIFAEIIEDEEHHKRILATTKAVIDWRTLVDWRAAKKTSSGPEVQFKNPDAWSVPSASNM